MPPLRTLSAETIRTPEPYSWRTCASLESFADSSHLPPETAAEIYAVEPPPMDSGAPDSSPKVKPTDSQ